MTEFVEDTYLKREYGLRKFLYHARHNQLMLYPPALRERNLLSARFLFLTSFLVLKPDYIEQVLLTNQQNYPKSRFVRNLLVPLVGEGLLTSEGAFWRRQRQIAAPAFQHRKIAEFGPIMAGAAAALAERWRQRSGPFDLCPDMMGLTLEIIARAMFSADFRDKAEIVRRLMDVAAYEIKVSPIDLFGLPEWLPRFWPKSVRDAVRQFNEMVAAIIAARRADGVDRGDLLSMLMNARDPDSGQAMSDKQLRDEMITILTAGHETTANGLSFCWWLLARHPECQARLQREVDRVLQGRPPSFADLPSLPYCRMVFEETLRLYPPAHTISRRALRDDKIGGVRVPAGANITISPFATHRNPHLWPDPDRFDPERFHPDQAAKRHRFAFLPFGGGPRICIGMHFAIAEAQIIIATLAQSFSVKTLPGHVVEPVATLTLRAKNGIQVVVEPRGDTR